MSFAGTYTAKTVFGGTAVLRIYSHGAFTERVTDEFEAGDWVQKDKTTIELVYGDGSNVEATLTEKGNLLVPHFRGGHILWERRR